MLQKIYIQNFAIIDEVEINFQNNLNIITGETGAGKSILLGALGLILGDRADTNVLLQKEKKCIIEGCFNYKTNDSIEDFFTVNELDFSNEIIIRREINNSGKSRAFVNDTPVTVNQLKNLGNLLVDLHQQFDTLELSDTNFQLEVIDAVAENKILLDQYKLAYQKYQLSKKEFTDLQTQQTNANTTLDYNQFLYNELEEINLKENELEDLDGELKLMSNAENIKQQLDSIQHQLKESDQPIVQQLKTIINKLQALTQYNSTIENLCRRLNSLHIELTDVSDEIEQINEAVNYNEEKIQMLQDRLSTGYKLLKKHNVHTTNELLTIQQNLSNSLQKVFSLENNIQQKEKEVSKFFNQCSEIANKLSINRSNAITPFNEKVNNLLTQVGMPNAKLKINILDTELNNKGKNTVAFLFDANNTKNFEAINKVASGGELSRLMLCIKSLVANKLQLPTLIFDEIDTGISGEAAKQVGKIMQNLAQKHQVISITHQPQIAAKAHAHYFVYKAIKNDKIVTDIRLLNNDERITCIAQMLSGEKPTASALANAKEMIST